MLFPAKWCRSSGDVGYVPGGFPGLYMVIQLAAILLEHVQYKQQNQPRVDLLQVVLIENSGGK